jgi:NAD(P)-dependent dehydrogenase (short-subunit alcohol dehydrogenase family)
MMPARGLEGKCALVTGAGTGIGREIAIEFARQGANVVLHYSHQKDGAESAAAEIRASGRQAFTFAANFDLQDEANALADYALAMLHRVDCLVNNAGITFNRPFLQISPAQFDKLFNVNMRAQFFITQRLVPNMIETGGGSICNISSIHGFQGAPEHSAYAATKGAIIAYTRALAVELAHRNIRVNGIAPGWITVQNYYKAIPGFNEEDARKDAYDAVPTGRYGTPLDVARMAAFLCSTEADFLVGQTVILDGGTTSLMSLISNFRSASTARFGRDYLPE